MQILCFYKKYIISTTHSRKSKYFDTNFNLEYIYKILSWNSKSLFLNNDTVKNLAKSISILDMTILLGILFLSLCKHSKNLPYLPFLFPSTATFSCLFHLVRYVHHLKYKIKFVVHDKCIQFLKFRKKKIFNF